MGIGLRSAAAAVALLAIGGSAAAGDDDVQQELKRTREQVETLQKRIDALDGGDLLRRFPPPEWSEKRIEDILRREVVEGIFRSADEKEFIDNFKAWQKALERRQANSGAKPEASAPTDIGKAVDEYLAKHPPASAGGNSNVSAPGCKSLKFSGQVLVWGERWDGTYRPTDPAGTDVQDVGWLRVSLQADAEIEDGLRARVEIRDARAFGQEPSTTTQAQAPGTGLDLKQGWFEVDDVLGGGVKVRAGRMVLSYGEQRLVGDLDWATYGRSFDGVLASRVFDATKTKVDLFATRVTERGLGTVTPGVDNDDRDFFGVYTTTPKALHHSDLDLYLLYLRDLQAAPGELPGSAGDTGFWTGGARLSGVKGSLDWGAEGALQDGRLKGDRLWAWAAHAEAGWTLLESKWTPRVSLEYDRATGDGNPANGRSGSFQTLFPTNHSHYGILDLAAWQNMQAVGATLRLKPAPKWTVDLGAWKLWLDRSADAWYGANGTVIRPGAPGASKALGTELDAVLTWKGSDHLKVSLGGSQFFDGGFVRDTGGGGDTLWCYLRVQVDF